MMPSQKPKNPLFCSGPCSKRPGWSTDSLKNAMISRSHRSPEGQDQIKYMLDLVRDVLEIPVGHKIALVPGSATGAITMAMMNFLGSRPVDILSWDVFGRRWAEDVKTMHMSHAIHHYDSEWGAFPDFSTVNSNHDLLFVWNATSTGSSIKDLNWYIPGEGLTICDATSAAFCEPLPWEKLDVTCFSWQKGLGGEAAHGIIVLSPKALQHLQTTSTPWGVPYFLSLKRGSGVRETLFDGDVINTPSMLCVWDAIQSLEWAKQNGGASFLYKRCERNSNIVKEWVDNHDFAHFLTKDEAFLSKANACIQIEKKGVLLTEAEIGIITKQLKELEVAYDIKGFKGVPGNIRVWTGPTIEASDVECLLEWIEWAIQQN